MPRSFESYFWTVIQNTLIPEDPTSIAIYMVEWGLLKVINEFGFRSAYERPSKTLNPYCIYKTNKYTPKYMMAETQQKCASQLR